MFFLKKGKFSSRLWAMTNNASKFGKIRCLCGGGRRLTPGKPAGVEEAELFRGQGEGDVLAEKQLAQKEQAELGNARITASQYQGETAGGYYVLRGAYQCIEDIGVEEQILLD